MLTSGNPEKIDIIYIHICILVVVVVVVVVVTESQQLWFLATSETNDSPKVVNIF